MPEYPQVVQSFQDVQITNVTAKGHKEVDSTRKESIKNGTGTLSLNERVHLNCSPVDMNGSQYPGGSEVVRSWKKEDGTSPLVEWQWYCGERELSNSGNDPFQLGSYEDDGGCTPTLTLREQVGEGRNEIHARPFIRAKYNGGVAVTGRAVVFYAD